MGPSTRVALRPFCPATGVDEGSWRASGQRVDCAPSVVVASSPEHPVLRRAGQRPRPRPRRIPLAITIPLRRRLVLVLALARLTACLERVPGRSCQLDPTCSANLHYCQPRSLFRPTRLPTANVRLPLVRFPLHHQSLPLSLPRNTSILNRPRAKSLFFFDMF